MLVGGAARGLADLCVATSPWVTLTTRAVGFEVALASGWQVTPYVTAALLAGAVAVVFAARLWWRDRRPGSLALVTLAVGAALWSFFYGLELASQAFATKLLLSRLSYLGIVLVPPAWFAFALAYTGHGDRLTPRTVGLLLLPPVIVAVLPWTSETNDLFWASTALVTSESTPMLALEYGPLFWAWVTYGYALLAGGTVLLLWSMPGGIRLFRAQTLLLLVGVLAPWVANLVYLSRLFGPTMLDVTPFGFVVSALALGGGFLRYQLLEVHPATRAVARDELIDRMAAGVVVLNDDGRIVDLNRSAEAVLDVVRGDVVGDPLTATAPELAAAVADAGGEAVVEFATGEPTRHYEVRVSPLRRGRTGDVGRLVTLSDVTERRRRERHLAVLNRVLRHDLRNDVSVIQGSAKLLEDDPGNEKYAALIADQAAEMLTLLRTVQEVEHALDAGRPSLTEVDVVRVVDEQVAAARQAHPEATVETDLPVDAWVHTTDLVSSAVDNLVENAIEHSDRERPHVRVTVSRLTEEDGRYVEVRVADDGPGIPEADRKVLLGGDSVSLADASGLGLWLVNWIVTESGGEVRYEANDPRGSIVVVRFRRAEDAAAERDDPLDPETLPSPSAEPVRGERGGARWSAAD
jgi:signal transduction histidine kinase